MRVRVFLLRVPPSVTSTNCPAIIIGMNTVKSSLSSFSDADVGYNRQSTSHFLVGHLLPVAIRFLSHPALSSFQGPLRQGQSRRRR